MDFDDQRLKRGREHVWGISGMCLRRVCIVFAPYPLHVCSVSAPYPRRVCSISAPYILRNVSMLKALQLEDLRGR